jgi:LmbE family N-acetylglucosaminyl deacetylase
VNGTVVLSPHLDDAVLSCGQLLAARPGSMVVTVFAGAPRQRRVRTPYDVGCGFRCSVDAVRARRAEDATACAALHARFVHLDWLDGQYRAEPVGRDALAVSVREAVHRDDEDPAVFAPLGVGHADHDAVSDAALAADIRDLWLYEELPTRVLNPELAHARLKTLGERGVVLDFTAREVGPVEAKEGAMAAYVSQTHDKGSLGNRHAYLVPERYWRVVR